MASPTISGLSGFDSSSLVSSLVSIASAPLTALQTKQTNVDSASTAMSKFSTQLAALKTAADAISTPTGFSSMSATSSDTGIVASVSGAPIQSTYAINVTQLAKAEKVRTDAQTSATTALGKVGTLSLQIGTGTTANVSIAATDTLTDIASKINGAGLRATASIVDAGGSYVLQLQGLDTGAANAINVTETGFTLGLNKPANITQAAQDAKLTVDGLAISRSTNSVSGVIDGVTLALKNVTSTPATLDVAPSPTGLETKINAFVSAFNSMVTTVHTSTGYGSNAATNSELASDSAMRRTLEQLGSMIATPVTGATGTYSLLAEIGLKHATDGSLAFDTTTFEAAMAKDPTSVASLFVKSTTTGTTGIMTGLSALVSTATGAGGAVANRITSLQQQSSRLKDQQTAEQSRIDAYQTQLKAQYSQLDIIMSKYQTMSSSISNLSGWNFSG